MKTDTSQIKPRLGEYLQRMGVRTRQEGSKTKYACPSPDHQDSKPSCELYENPSGDHVLVCMSTCGQKSWDIFEIAGMLQNANTFPEKLKAVQDTLGITETPTATDAPPPKKTTQKKQNTDYVTLSKEEAATVYTGKNVDRLFAFIYKDKSFTRSGSWPYKDKDGNIMCMDIRADLEDGSKNVSTFWYTGKSLKLKTPPNLIYNLDEILNNPDKPVLISEGCKCAELSRALKIFTPCTWNGGTGRVGYIDWTPLANHEVYILRDDDAPGLKAALKIKDALPQAKIIEPPEGIRKIKKKGGDIEEMLSMMNPDELTKYILSSPEAVSTPATLNTHTNPSQPPTYAGGAASGDDRLPFKMLGVGDDGFLYFLDETGRLRSYQAENINKQKLLVLAPRYHWYEDYQTRDGKISWDSAIDDILRLSLRADFDVESIRGRGAWREKDGRICYHDGVDTVGDPCKKRLYLRKARVDIGLADKHIDIETREKIKKAVFRMSFETEVDAVRALAWATLAPFAGALKVRPSLLCTGESESGKSTLVNEVINPMTLGLFFNGETSPAGIKGKTNKDSYPIKIDEAEPDEKASKYGNDNRTELFKLMRISYSDDSPDTGKGTKDGGFRSSKMTNMFLFNAIDAGINNVQDENRIFRVNMIKGSGKNKWKALEKEIKSLMTDKNCRSLRALTWKKLKYIFELADRLTEYIIDETGKGYRSCYAEGLLCAAYIMIWKGMDNPSVEFITNFIGHVYKLQPPEETRNASEEIVDRLLDEVIEIIHSGKREKITILEGLKRIKIGVIVAEEENNMSSKMIKETVATIARHGVKLVKGEVAICTRDHHQVKRIIQKGNGYKKLLWRHKGIMSRSESVTFPDKSRRCAVIGGLVVLEDEVTEEKIDEDLGNVL